MKRVLLDANVFISYLLRRETGSAITRIVEAGIAGAFTILLPEALLEEFTARIGQKPYLAERIRPVEMSQFSEMIWVYSKWVERQAASRA